MPIFFRVLKETILAIQQQVMPGYTGQVFSWGNSTLPRNVLIANITSTSNCPSKQLGLCKIADVCYALHDEKQWPNTRHKNLTVEAWMKKASENDIIRILEAYIDGAPISIEYLRLNEAGDFTSQDNVDMWDRIADHLYTTKGVKTYTYTARADLDFSEVKHIVVNGSLPGIKGAVRTFSCVPKAIFDLLPIGKGEYKCPGRCDVCHVCFEDKFKGVIYCKKH